MPLWVSAGPHAPEEVQSETYNGSSSVTTFAANAAINSAAQPRTIVVAAYWRGTGGGGVGYLASDCDSGTLNGFRLFLQGTGGLSFGADSTGTGGSPFRISAATFSTGTYLTNAVTFDGSLAQAGINLYQAAGAAPLQLAPSYGSGADGTTAFRGSTSNYLLGNRAGLARTFDGDIYFVAQWKRVLSLAELRDVQLYGPLAVPDGLVFCRGNNFDYGPLALNPTSRTAIARGAWLPYCAPISRYDPRIGMRSFFGPPADLAAITGVSATGNVGSVTVSGAAGIVIDTSQGNGITASPSSSVAGNVITLIPRVTVNEGTLSWQHMCVKVSGVNGLTPIFKIDGSVSLNNSPWQSTEPGYFSYDRLNWTKMGVAVNLSSPPYIQCQHNAAFTQDVVWFSRVRRIGVYAIRDWIDNTLVPSFSSKLFQVASGTNFVADNFSTQTDELGRTVASQPLFAWWIKSGGAGKKKIVLTGGVHANEDQQDWNYRGAIQWLCGSAPEAVALLNAFDVLCIPLANAPGREGGHFRAQFQSVGSGTDLNRHFSDTTVFETVSKVRAVINAEIADGNLSAMIDWHGFAGPEGTGFSPNATDWWKPPGAFMTAFDAALVSRFGWAGTGVALPTGSMTYWATAVKGAPLSTMIENNSGADGTAANATLWGSKVLLALYDILGMFPGASTVQEGTASAVDTSSARVVFAASKAEGSATAQDTSSVLAGGTGFSGSVSEGSATAAATQNAVICRPIHPSSDIAAGGWIASAGGTLAGTIDEATPDDSDYMQSPANPANATADIQFATPASVPAINTDYMVRYRVIGQGIGTLTVTLYCGATPVRSWVHDYTPRDYTQVLTTAEAAAITDKSQLHIKWTAD